MKICIFICLAFLHSFAACLAQTPASPRPSATPARLGLYFDAVHDDAQRGDQWFTINYAGRRIPTQFAKLGESIAHTEYTVIGYSPQPKPAILIIEHNATHAKFQLELGKLTWVDP